MKSSKIVALLILGTLVAGPTYAVNKPAAKVNGIAIPQERVDMYVNAVIARSKQQDNPDLRKKIREKLIDLEVMSQQAISLGLDKKAETREQIGLARQNILSGALMQDYVKTRPVSEDAIQQEYDKEKPAVGSKEYNVRHILVEKESEAKQILAKLKKGGKDGEFSKLAKVNSKDSGSRDQGGSLGWVPATDIPSTYVKPFAEAVIALSEGQISEPVKSQFGWHIIKLQEVRDIKFPALEQVKPQIVQRLQQQAMKKYISDLHDKAKIE